MQGKAQLSSVQQRPSAVQSFMCANLSLSLLLLLELPLGSLEVRQDLGLFALQHRTLHQQLFSIASDLVPLLSSLSAEVPTKAGDTQGTQRSKAHKRSKHCSSVA